MLNVYTELLQSCKHLRGEKNLPFFLLPANEELAKLTNTCGMRTHFRHNVINAGCF